MNLKDLQAGWINLLCVPSPVYAMILRLIYAARKLDPGCDNRKLWVPVPVPVLDQCEDLYW